MQRPRRVAARPASGAVRRSAVEHRCICPPGRPSMQVRSDGQARFRHRGADRDLGTTGDVTLFRRYVSALTAKQFPAHVRSARRSGAGNEPSGGDPVRSRPATATDRVAADVTAAPTSPAAADIRSRSRRHGRSRHPRPESTSRPQPTSAAGVDVTAAADIRGRSRRHGRSRHPRPESTSRRGPVGLSRARAGPGKRCRNGISHCGRLRPPTVRCRHGAGTTRDS
jgi:hypothetical protein